MANILIADETYGKDLSRLLGRHSICLAFDSLEVRRLLCDLRPELLILDLELPGIDVLSLLQLLQKEAVLPEVMILSRFVSDYTLRTLERLEVAYLIRKPCEPAAIAERAEDIIRYHGERKAAEPGFLELLIELGVPLHLKGGKYLREAVVLMQKRPDQYMTKELYPTVGQRFGTNARTVERDIRTVIELAWKKRDRELWKRVFLPAADPDAKKPSNTVFIGTIAAMFDRYAG